MRMGRTAPKIENQYVVAIVDFVVDRIANSLMCGKHIKHEKMSL